MPWPYANLTSLHVLVYVIITTVKKKNSFIIIRISYAAPSLLRLPPSNHFHFEPLINANLYNSVISEVLCKWNHTVGNLL